MTKRYEERLFISRPSMAISCICPFFYRLFCEVTNKMRSFDRFHIDIESLRPRNPDLQEEIFDRVIANLYLNLKKQCINIFNGFFYICITPIFANKRISSLAKVVENLFGKFKRFSQQMFGTFSHNIGYYRKRKYY